MEEINERGIKKKNDKKKFILNTFIQCHKSIVISFKIENNNQNDNYYNYIITLSTKNKEPLIINTTKTTLAIYPLENNIDYNLTITIKEDKTLVIKNTFNLLDKLSKTLLHYGYYHSCTAVKYYGNIYIDNKDNLTPTDWTTTNHIFLNEQTLSLVEKSKTKVILDTRWLFFEGTPCIFSSNWKIRWDNNYKPLLKQYEHLIEAFYLDEPFWSLGLTNELLEQWILILKTDFKNIPLMLVFAYPLLCDGSDKYKDKLEPLGTIKIPKNIDWIGYDMYDIDEETIYKNHEILKKVAAASNNQKLIVVSQAVRLDTTKSIEEADLACLINNAYYFNLCNEDPDIICNLVFMYYQTDWLGAINLPETYKFQQFMGKEIKASSLLI